MYINLDKLKENDIFVWYKFEMPVIDLNNLKAPNKLKFGVCKFNKLDSIPGKSIEFIKEESDEYFWNNSNILMKCLLKMVQCKKNNKYPERLQYASG